MFSVASPHASCLLSDRKFCWKVHLSLWGIFVGSIGRLAPQHVLRSSGSWIRASIARKNTYKRPLPLVLASSSFNTLWPPMSLNYILSFPPFYAYL